MSAITTSSVGLGLSGREAGLMRRPLLIGPPGAGKSSQGLRLAERLGVCHVSTGALLREECDARPHRAPGRGLHEYRLLARIEAERRGHHVRRERLNLGVVLHDVIVVVLTY